MSLWCQSESSEDIGLLVRMDSQHVILKSRSSYEVAVPIEKVGEVLTWVISVTHFVV